MCYHSAISLSPTFHFRGREPLKPLDSRSGKTLIKRLLLISECVFAMNDGKGKNSPKRVLNLRSATKSTVPMKTAKLKPRYWPSLLTFTQHSIDASIRSCYETFT